MNNLIIPVNFSSLQKFNMIIFLLAVVFFFITELLYFKLANHFNIIDKPNQRSSHTQITLRGGGILFPIALIISISLFQISYWYLAVSVFVIAIISFLDDIITLNNKLRITVHILSVLLMLYQVFINHGWILPIIVLPIIFIFIIGIINAYNFMDGINGITVLYSIVTIGSLWYTQILFDFFLFPKNGWIIILSSLLVFAYFNLRKKAKTFAGDVGSISIALIICFFLLQLIIQSEDWKWILFLGIYGLDAVATISCRLLRKENIFEAHRSHFYQFLANEKQWTHVKITIIYALIQLGLNIMVIYSNSFLSFITYIFITIAYIIVRLRYEGKQRLFTSYSS